MAEVIFLIARLLYRRSPREARGSSAAHTLQSGRPIVEPDGAFRPLPNRDLDPDPTLSQNNFWDQNGFSPPRRFTVKM
jgi:hypothetical protein